MSRLKESDQLTPEGIESKVSLFKVRDPRAEVVRPWPLNWKIPANAALAIGVPKGGEPLRIAFCSSGGSITHEALRAVAAPDHLRYEYVKAYTFNKAGRGDKQIRVLHILEMDQKDARLVENLGVETNYKDPRSLLSEAKVTQLLHVLKADVCEFVVNPRWEKIISEAQAQLARGIPLSGLEHLRWVCETRKGD